MATNFYPTPDKVIKLFKQADAPNIEQRNVRPLLDLLNKISFFSPRIAGHILTRKTAITSYDWTINTDIPELSSQLKSILRPFINTITENYINAVCFGVFAITYTYKFTNNFNVPVVDAVIHPTLLDFQDGVVYFFDEKTGQYTPLDENSTITFIYNPHTRGGVLRTILLAEILRYNTLMEWANLNKLLKGIITTMIDPEKLANTKALLRLSDEAIAKNLDNIDNAVINSDAVNYLRTLNFAETKAQQIANAQSGASYSEFIDALNNDIAIAFLGQANSTELPNQGGSRAALQVLNLIRSDILFADLNNIKQIVNKYLLNFYRVNYNPNATECPFLFEFVFDETEDVETNARMFEYIARIGGVLVDANEFYTKLGLTRPDGVPDVISIGERNI